MLWKLDGLGEYDVRRPLTPTGTNLLGLVVDGAAGVRPDNDNLPPGNPARWDHYRARLERVAREAGGLPPAPAVP